MIRMISRLKMTVFLLIFTVVGAVNASAADTYTAGTILIAPPDGEDKDPVPWPEPGTDLFEYDLQNDTTGMFNMVYTPHAGESGTERTVLVVTWPEYGTKKTSVPSAGANHISSISFPDSHTVIIALEDYTTEQCTFGFTIAADNLTNEQAARWMDGGDMTTGYTATEYQLNEGFTLTGSTTLAELQENATAYASFTQNAIPKVYAESTVPAIRVTNAQEVMPTWPSYLHTYHWQTSSVPQVTQTSLSKVVGQGYGPLEFFHGGGTQHNGEFRWDIPTVHNLENPLIEITNVRVYVPCENLKLASLTATTTSDGLNWSGNGYYPNGCDLNFTCFDQQWNGWTISAPVTDGNGHTYYDLKPSSRWFNVGVSLTSRYYGVAPVFQLISLDQPLTPGAFYQAEDTVITYKQVGVSGEQTYTQSGPDLQVFERGEDITPSTAYNENRFKNRSNQSNLDVVVGSAHTGEVFTYFNNQYRYYYGTPKVESVPSTQGPFTMHYEFPYSIQPSRMIINRCRYLNENQHHYEALLNSISYETADGVTHSATVDEVAAINSKMNTYNGVGTFTFSAVTESNRVVSVDIVWDKLYADYGFSNVNGETYNNAATGALGGTSVFGDLCLISTNFDYIVAADSLTEDTTVDENLRVRVKYDLIFNGESHTDENWLWFRLIPQKCPLLKGTGNGTVGWLDNKTDSSIGKITLYVGAYGEYTDDLWNPVIDLKMGFFSVRSPARSNNTNVAENDDVLSLFTGKFTADPKLSGWKFNYTTLLHPEGKSWTVPELTAATAVQIPLEEGDYFKTLSMHYDGKVSFPHTGPEDTRTSYTLMDNIAIRRLSVDPFTGEKILSNSLYQMFYATMYGWLRFDDCACSTGIHNRISPTTGQPLPSYTGQMMSSSTGSPYYSVWTSDYPCAPLFTSRSVLLYWMGASQSVSSDSISQGQSLKYTITPSISPAKDNYTIGLTPKDAFHYNYQYGDISNSADYFIPVDIKYPVYVELTDNDFTVDLTNTTYMGIPVSSGMVEAEEITVNGRRFLKMQFVDGAYQTDDSSYYFRYFAKYPGVLYYRGPGTNLCSKIEVGLTALPSARIGEHYPIGKVYYDYSELLEKYDAPNDTGNDFPDDPYSTENDYNMTNYTFSGAVPDEYGLSHTTTTETNKLFMSDFGEGSSTAQKVTVSIAAVTGADGFPGKGGIYDIAGRTINFTEPETETLSGLVTVKGSTTNIITDYVTCVKFPRQGKGVDYIDASGNSTTATSDMTVELRGPITRVNKTGVEDADFTILYTTDEDPTAGSTYVNAASIAAWSAVTGFKIIIGKVAPEGAITLYMNLRTGKKETLDVLRGYMGGSYSYKLQGMDGEGLMGLSTWNYKNIPVTGTTGGIIFWDTYNENGTKATSGSGNDVKCETGIGGIPVTLYDKDDNLIMSTASGASATLGQFTLESWKSDAGQYIVIGQPTVSGVTAKLTKNSTAVFYQNQYDSDFDRNAEGTTHKLVLPQLPSSGFSNIGAGFVKLPTIAAEDITLLVGDTADISATLTYYLGEGLTNAGANYNISFDDAADESIADVAKTTVTTASPAVNNSNARIAGGTTTVTGVASGNTTVRICTVTVAGDTIEKTVNICVLNTVAVTIKKSGMRAGDSTIFTVTKKGESTPLYTVPLTMDSSGSAQVTLKAVPVGEYTVTEITDWSWAYTPDPASGKITQNIGEKNTFTFKNTPKKDIPPHAEVEKNNVLKEKKN